MNLFSYDSDDITKNIGLVVKGQADKPSYRVDMADGLIGNATITTTSAIALDSTGAMTTNVVGTTAVSGTVVRVDLKTCGASGTGNATNGDRFRVTLTVTPSTGGPLTHNAYVLIDANSYDS